MHRTLRLILAMLAAAVAALGIAVVAAPSASAFPVTIVTLCKNATFSDGTQVFRSCVDVTYDQPDGDWYVRKALIWNVPLPSGHTDNLEGSAFYYSNGTRYYYGTIGDGATRRTPMDPNSNPYPDESGDQYRIAAGTAARFQGYSTYDGRCHRTFIYRSGAASQDSYAGQC